MMIVFCEECGRKYRVDIGKIKGKSAKFTCKSCGHLIVVTKPDAEPVEQSASFADGTEAIAEADSTFPLNLEPDAEPEPIALAIGPSDRAKGIGLRRQIMIVLIVVPVIILFAAGLFCLSRPNDISASLSTYKTRIAPQTRNHTALNAFESDLIHHASETNRFMIVVWVASCLVILAIATTYFLRMAGRIETLAQAAQRISLGALDTEIDSTHRDEIGQIAEAIARLQDSMRLALNRLRR